MNGDAVNRLKSYFEDIFKDRARLVRILLIVLILLSAVLLKMHENGRADITVDSSGETAGVSDEICVDIGGAVVNPGVYTVSRETRLYEVIEMAGGLLSSADTESINRAEYVEDGEKIIIPVRRTPDESASDDGAYQEGDPGDAALTGTDTDSSPLSSTGGLVNINTADKEELKTLSGIGDAKADRIIEYRQSTRFRKKEDILSVNGIGEAIYDRIKDSITV